MGWQVSSTIYGGTRYSAATKEEYTAFARLLDNAAADWRNAANTWTSASLGLDRQRLGAPMCPTLACGRVEFNTAQHVTLPYDQLRNRCLDHAGECRRIADVLSDMAVLLIRAHSLYSETESWMTRLLNELLQGVGTLFPKQTAVGAGLIAGAGILGGSLGEGALNPAYGLPALAWAHEGLLGSVAGRIAGVKPLEGLTQTDEVNQAAGRLSMVTKPVKDLAQGDALYVAEVTTDVPVVGESASVAQSLENLRRLAEERLGKIELDSGLSYATIAIQRYRRADGTSSWLVTIPGTDGQSDSPFGWSQNIELMSDDPRQRMQADSARMVAEAMRQAGIGKDEPVALIGHSQGGIVAAAIASDMQDEYNFEHVVTAGSPVANHPIPSKTWVTSIEIEDELVAALDGASNPTTENWLTIRGRAYATASTSLGGVGADGVCVAGDADTARSRNYFGAEVKDAPDSKEITHWLKYHQAAYRNATDLGSPAVLNHEEHFRQVIDGELEETRYFQGRMYLSTNFQTPSKRDVEVGTLGE